MKKLVVTLAALAVAAPAAAQDVAPAVKRKPAVTSKAPAAPAQAVATPADPAAPRQTASTGPAAPQQVPRTTNERDVQAALAAAAGPGAADSALDAGLIRTMARLVTTGRCRDAAGLASREGRKELASRAQQLCR